MENHHAINGKIHYFYGHFQLQTVSSPEGIKKIGHFPPVQPRVHIKTPVPLKKSGVSQPLREILGGEASATFKGLELENMENQD